MFCMLYFDMEYRIDLFALFILLGIVQAIFLSFFFFAKENRKNPVNLLQGWLLLAIAMPMIEIFLMYTGYIQHVLHLVDFSESVALAIGPLFYLIVLTSIDGRLPKNYYLHFIPFVLYSFYLLFFLTLPEDAKYNAWIGAYHPDLPRKEIIYPHSHDPIGIRSRITEITLAYLFMYAIFCLIATIRAFRFKQESFWRPQSRVLKSLQLGVFQLLSVTLVVFIVKLLNLHDTGDHLYAVYIALIVYLISFTVIKNSSFFKPASLTEKEKYKSSSLSEEQQEILLQKIKQIMQDKKPFLNADFSLPDLAQSIGTTVHITSQLINENLNQNFFEFIAGYRINAAKEILLNEPYLKIEEVAERVGYNSKSSFNTAFKRISRQTPSEFKQQHAAG